MNDIYERVGGAGGVRRLVDRFYDEMDAAPEARPIRDLHPADLTSSREKLFEFLSGWMGGPQLYVEKYGHPRLRARHLPFPIADAEAEQWMACMSVAIHEVVADEEARRFLLPSFAKVAAHMRNADDA